MALPRSSAVPNPRMTWKGTANPRVAMVGDRLSSDIEGGRRAGLATILVLSGTDTRGRGRRRDPPPDHVVDDLAALLR